MWHRKRWGMESLCCVQTIKHNFGGDSKSTLRACISATVLLYMWCLLTSNATGCIGLQSRTKVVRNSIYVALRDGLSAELLGNSSPCSRLPPFIGILNGFRSKWTPKQLIKTKEGQIHRILQTAATTISRFMQLNLVYAVCTTCRKRGSKKERKPLA